MDNITTPNRRKQRTLKTAIEYAGIGLHTGETVFLRIIPAEENTGIRLRRTDLADSPEIPATIPYVCDTSDRCTVLGNGQVKIYTVEHLMAALYANQVDNAIVELSNIEPPVGNGSSDIFVDLICQAGTAAQQADRDFLAIDKPVYYSQNDIHIIALPCDSYRISYTLNYPQVPALKSQYNSFFITPEAFNSELSPCRTFCLYSEISALMDRGLIKGGSLDNAVVIKDDAVISKRGMFFHDEPARHKILDIVGDLALVGCDIHAHIIAVRAGHAANYAIAKQLHTIFQKELTHDSCST